MSLHKIFLAALLLASTNAVQAKVPPEQMARLDQDLTPLGSERGPNKDGSIPAWTGGLTSPPEGIGYEKANICPTHSPPISPYCVLQANAL